jgi:hypothetical protein
VQVQSQSQDLFDVLPVRGTLEPGQSEDVEFVFYGRLGTRARAR